MKARYFVGISVLLLGLSVLGLRANNVTAGNMLMRLLERDAAGENTDTAVEEIRQFVFTHMNTSMQFTLDGAYARAVVDMQARIDNSANNKIYIQAAAACDREGQLTTANAECVQNYVEQRLGQAGKPELPEPKQFSYTFNAPFWANDLPGLALLGALLSGFIAAILYGRGWLRRSSSQ